MDTHRAWVAAAFLGLFAGACSKKEQAAEPEPAPEKVRCEGINACKGKSACHTDKTTCAGENACKGQGWVEVAKKECQEKGGKILPGSAGM
jgi:uncharacterized membrane protein